MSIRLLNYLILVGSRSYNQNHPAAMASTPPNTNLAGSKSESTTLPPEAIALASRFFDAARSGTYDILEQALSRGLPPNLTNDKGDTLVGILLQKLPKL